jgi:SNF2 family DNA or RNA helicase
MWTDVTKGEFKGRVTRTIGTSLKHCARHFGWDDEAEDARPPGCVLCQEIEDAFYNMLAPYMTRRTKAEALPWLPPKQFIPLWVDFGSESHRKQYTEFNHDLQTMIDGMPVSSVNVLDEYTRLKQFSFSRHERRDDGKLVPTEDSGKLDAIRQKLDELGIWDGSSKEQAIIFSQFSEVVDLIHRWLNANGVPASKITGAVNKTGQRDAIKKEFQSGAGARVICITTTAGGVSITLDAASTVFIVDETWDPDDQEQAEDRAHRASRIHQVSVYYVRTLGTIEEDIAEVTGTKRSRNVRVLDSQRLRQRAKRVKQAA